MPHVIEAGSRVTSIGTSDNEDLPFKIHSVEFNTTHSTPVASDEQSNANGSEANAADLNEVWNL